MHLEPISGLIQTDDLSSDDGPEARTMVGFDEMRHLMGDHIVDDEQWSLDQTPVETEITVGRARTPSISIFGDPYLATDDPQ